MFLCPTCRQKSVETLYAYDTQHNPPRLRTEIRQRVVPVYCQLCKAICSENVEIHLGMHDISEEEVPKIGSGPSSGPVA